MVHSPRKRILQASASTRHTTGSGPTHNKEKARVKTPLAFESYKFFLDIRGKAKASLIEDLQNLGGVSRNM